MTQQETLIDPKRRQILLGAAGSVAALPLAWMSAIVPAHATGGFLYQKQRSSAYDH